jgi:hypothetical protein
MQKSDPLQDFGGHSYKAVFMALKWNAAREDAEQRTQCSGVPSHLVSVTSATEVDFVASMYRNIPLLGTLRGVWTVRP